MERRRFLCYGLTMTGALALGVLRVDAAQPRSAIVIGVDKAGDLPPLRAAKSGAREVAQWLQREGFTVKLFVDDTKPVRVADLFDAVNAIVSQGNQRKLIIYFAGHGFINNYSEYWLLSQAPENPNEAISLIESVALARQSGIPNVVFISDACRSRSDSLRTERVRGSLIFPTSRGIPATPSDVDLFLATLVGDPSWEAAVSESSGVYQGVYTSTFLDAFRHPDTKMIRKVDGKDVVPNYQLKDFLAREVPKRAQAVSIRINQRPDSQVMSGEGAYIGLAASSTPANANTSIPATLFDVASSELDNAGVAGLWPDNPRPSAESISIAAADSGFNAARDIIVQARGVPSEFVVNCGFSVSGQRLVDVTASKGALVKFVNDRDSALVEVILKNMHAASVALRFANGSGTVLAAINGYVGNVVVDRTSVSNVSYVPAPSSPMRSFYLSEEKRLIELRAAVATAARFGVFRIEGSRDQRNDAARRLADRIRVLKGVDPTLGIYCAYAYYDAGLPKKVESVASYMYGDLGVDLFDVAMLAGSIGMASRAPVPFIPMLSQGWSLLRVKGVRLPERILNVHEFLIPGLWTTLDRTGMNIVGEVLRQGADQDFRRVS